MAIPSNPELRPHVFTDEVDRLVEFIDANTAEHIPPTGVRAAGAGKPVLTDVVDRVVEFADAPANEHTPQSTNGHRPIFVDTVDKLVEFFDQPVANVAKDRVAAPAAPAGSGERRGHE